MPEDSSKAAMQAFGVIPNAYFDLIARVMPGLLLLFGINCVNHKNAISSITDVFIPYGELRGSTTAWLLVILSTGYILGHALSPLVRFLEEGPQFAKTIRTSVGEKKGWLRFFPWPPFWRSVKASSDDRLKLQQDYNTLRFRNPSLAALAIRIRAEYTMYGGFAVALAITLLLAFLHLLQAMFDHRLAVWLHGVSQDNWLFLAIGILAVPMMLYRHLHTWDRFCKTVVQLLDASTTHGVITST